MDNNSASLPIQEDALKFHMRVSEVISTMLLPPPPPSHSLFCHVLKRALLFSFPASFTGLKISHLATPIQGSYVSQVGTQWNEIIPPGFTNLGTQEGRQIYRCLLTRYLGFLKKADSLQKEGPTLSFLCQKDTQIFWSG